MPIQPGQTLLHYRLVEQIGVGGMGAVWKAIDTTLDRDVAIKVLPEVFATDNDRLARFEREARLLASLNHPNVASIYGIHEAEGIRFLALELVEGEDLSQRMTRGALPREDALQVALEIARGFEAAHDKGVIHRDLKPANVKLSPDGAVKVLDFGLAKALSPEVTAAGADPSLSPTMTSDGTIAGMILGTAAYMSPEQAKGKPVDRRADIWSFGVVLFEMLAGRRLFAGETVSETLAAVIMKEPDWSTLPAGTPSAVLRLLQRCLKRNPRERLRDIGDARIVLQEALHEPESPDTSQIAPAPKARPLAWLPWLVAAAALVALAVVVLVPQTKQDSHGVMRLRLPIPEETRSFWNPIPMLALSPDGRKLAFVGRDDDNRPLLYVRAIDQSIPVALPGTQGAAYPIFSPDGEWVAFSQNGKFKKMPVGGGPAATLCDAPLLRGASWGSAGTIVFAPDRMTGLMRISDAGGTPEPLTTLDRDPASAIQPSHRWPEILPGGRTVLFTATDNESDYSEARIVALSLDDLQQTTLVERGSFPRYVPDGFLVFVRDDTLVAARFDPARLSLEGPAVPVLEKVGLAPFYGSAQLTFSENGILAYLEAPKRGTGESLIWVDRQGGETPASARKGAFSSMRLSPDGSRVAIEIPDRGNIGLWLLELERDTLSRLSFDSDSITKPVWSPDGEWVVYSALRDGVSRNLFRKRSNGTGESERLTTHPRHQAPTSWSPDGKLVVYEEWEGDTGFDIMLLRLDTDPPEAEVFLKTPFNERSAKISPDGRFLAYRSDEGGVSEVYVLPLGRSGGRTKISTGEAGRPRWTRDGSELLYQADDKLMSVRVSSTADGVLRAELPREVIDFPDNYGSWDISPDGERFLVDRGVANIGASLAEPNLVIGWFEELEATVPKRR